MGRPAELSQEFSYKELHSNDKLLEISISPISQITWFYQFINIYYIII